MLHADMIIDIIDPVYDEVECQVYCRKDFDCSFYSWFDSNGTLFQVTPHFTTLYETLYKNKYKTAQ